ncbi:hypothetical protein BGW36DRAFT_392864 [Talaromyces proteolyticus]|uniref:Biogenesis of lysosome-related organelles complex 1 subunit 1 n=1 Tax=Talaromyces proteolyticus TaxID=1131652 RepID=A0AAD4Q3L7_9EURO|nr:uncharacterized protein BGW36DRAFT_392864 [Talaromyces proteolyticus]KAH8705174.1 hypothetical protein BGW36DRAFT_392864 [Talaromyces proteolyticus]
MSANSPPDNNLPTSIPTTSTSTTTTNNSPSPSSSFTPQSSSSSPASSTQDQDPETARRTLEARTAFTASLHSVGQNVSSDLRARATDLHNNAAAIQKQENELTKHTTDLKKQNDQWDKVVESARQGLKEIGDVQNWAEMIERDLLVVEEVLRLAEGNAEAGEEDRRDHYQSEGEGDMTEREDGVTKGKKASQEPVEILDDTSSAASEMTGTSATSGSSSDSSTKPSPPVQDIPQPVRKGDGENKPTGGWWGRWWQ